MPVKRILCVFALAAFVFGCAAEEKNPEAALLDKARTAFVAQEFLYSEELYQTYLQTYPDGPDRLEAWNRLFDISRNIVKDNDKASRIIDAMIIDYSYDPQVIPGILERAADLCEAMKDFEREAALWDEYLDLPGLKSADARRALMEKARVLFQLKKSDAALDAYDACAKIAFDPDQRADCLSAKAELLGRLERTKEAETLLEEIRKDGKVSEQRRALAVFSLAEILENGGRKKEALALYESIQETYPNPHAVTSRIGYLRK